MTVEACAQVQIQHDTQDTAFAKHIHCSWKGADHDDSFSTEQSSLFTSPTSTVVSCSSSSLSLTPLPPYIDEEHRHSHSKNQQKVHPAMSPSLSAKNGLTPEELQLRIEKQEREIAALKLCLTATHQNWQEQVQRADEAVEAQQQAENEIEDLSTQLFEQANEMVAKERRERYAADEKTELIIQELKRTRNMLQRKHLLQSHIVSSPEPARNAPMMDAHSLSLFRDFVQRVRSMSLEHVHRLTFMKQCLEQDIYPCLQRMKRLSSRKLINSLVQQPCYIECKTTSAGSLTTIPCFACDSPLRRNEQEFQFRMNDSDRCWHRIDQSCKDRLMALSNFYEFIRHLHIGLQGQQRSIESLFHEMVWLRLYLFWTRSGIMIDDDISAESVLISISKLFEARSHLF